MKWQRVLLAPSRNGNTGSGLWQFFRAVRPVGEQIRVITAEVATVDGSWTVTGARDAAGHELPAINGRGFELVQKRHEKWRFIATREMVIFDGR